MVSRVAISSALPPELVSLVHHVELNKSGWWNQAIQRLILTIVWTEGSSRHLGEINESLRTQYRVNLDLKRTKSQVDALCKTGVLIPMQDGRYKISESAVVKLEKEIEEGDVLKRTVEVTFTSLIEQHCPSLNSVEVWQQFNEQFLQPLVKDIGANTYQLVAGKSLHLDSPKFDNFLRRYSEDVRASFRTAVEQFLDPKNIKTRSYILRSLNAYFFIEASSLKEETLETLTKFVGTKPTFTIFIDTNFFFSVLGLKNSSDDAARALTDLIEELAGKVTVKLYVLPTTCDEAKRVLISKKVNLSGFRLPPNLAEAAYGAGADTIEQKFFQECGRRGHISADSYFDPYIKDLVSVMRSKGVELYNADVEPYGLKQNVIDDINIQIDWEQRRYGERAKDYEKLRHDMVMWHFVNDKRKRHLESPLEANFWVVTFDYRFIGFDEFKSNNHANRVPVCIHPTTLIQMLQFFVPRTPRLEEAMLSSIRLPFLSQEFDPASERVTVSILKTLGRYQDVGDLKPETVSAILFNNALRQKLQVTQDEEEQIKLVKDALIQEHQRVQHELAEARRSIEQLKKESTAKDDSKRKLEEEVETYRETIQNTEQRLQTTEDRLEVESNKTKILESTVNQLQSDALAKREEERLRLEAGARRGERKSFVLRWVIAPILLFAVVDAAAVLVLTKYTSWGNWKNIITLVSTTVLLLDWMIDKRGWKKNSIKESRVFSYFHDFNSWFFWLLGTLTLGLVTNAIYDLIKATSAQS